MGCSVHPMEGLALGAWKQLIWKEVRSMYGESAGRGEELPGEFMEVLF